MDLLNLWGCILSCPVPCKNIRIDTYLGTVLQQMSLLCLEGKTFFRQHITIKVSKFRYAMQIEISPKYIILIQKGCSTDSAY